MNPDERSPRAATSGAPNSGAANSGAANSGAANSEAVRSEGRNPREVGSAAVDSAAGSGDEAAGNTVVIGIGDAYRHDDGVGLVVLQRLRERRPPAVDFAESDGEPTALIDAWAGAPLAIIIDAVDARGSVDAVDARGSVDAVDARGSVDGVDARGSVDGVDARGSAGRIYRLGPHDLVLAAGRATSSHGVPVGDALALGQALEQMPRRMLVYGIQVADVTAGVGLSAPVERAAAQVVGEIAELLGTERRAG